MPESHPQAVIEKIVREEWGRVLSVLVSQLNDFSLAEDALQDSLITALEEWQQKNTGIPKNPCAWLLIVAKRKIIDRIRRRDNFLKKEELIIAQIESELFQQNSPADMCDDDSIPDERLRLIFTCCHPGLAQEAQVALTLQTLGGLKMPEIARAFLVPETTMAQRLVRAKRKIKTAGIPYEIPNTSQLEERIVSVLEVIYLIFNEGYSVTSGDSPIRSELANEAIRLITILISLKPAHTEMKGLQALMLLHHSRSNARVTSDGEIITLEKQNRKDWNFEMIDQGLATLQEALKAKQPGPYQIQAAISALHAEALDYESTDWKQIYLLYKVLDRLQPSPIVKLNAIVALSYSGGLEAALCALEEIQEEPALKNYLPFFATEADIFRRLGNNQKARQAYHRAIQLAGNSSERRFFEKRIRELP